MFLLRHPHSAAGPAPRCSPSAPQSCTRTSAATSSVPTTPSSFSPRGLIDGDIWCLDIFEGDEYGRKDVTVRALIVRVVLAMLRTGMYRATRSARKRRSGLLGSMGRNARNGTSITWSRRRWAAGLDERLLTKGSTVGRASMASLRWAMGVFADTR